MAATTRQVLHDQRRETLSLFSTKHYSADNLANKCNLASADDRASADDLEIQYHLASADDLESRHKQTAAPTRKPTNPKRLCPREAVKFNAHLNGNRIFEQESHYDVDNQWWVSCEPCKKEENECSQQQSGDRSRGNATPTLIESENGTTSFAWPTSPHPRLQPASLSRHCFAAHRTFRYEFAPDVLNHGPTNSLTTQRVVLPTPPLIEAKDVGQPEDYTIRTRVE
jgi:hypothetical protein